MACEYSLVSFPILVGCDISLDVGGQRDGPELFQDFEGVTRWHEFSGPDASFTLFNQFQFLTDGGRVRPVGGFEGNCFTRLQVSSCLANQSPLSLWVAVQVESIPPSASGNPGSQEFGRNDLCVVDDQAVAGIENVGQFHHLAACDFLRLSVYDQQARVVSPGKWMRSD